MNKDPAAELRSFPEVPGPEVWGVLNLTPDSFFAGSRTHPEAAMAIAGQMLYDGADRLDLGAESSRPGSDRISSEEEWSRLGPVLRALVLHLPEAVSSRRISIDTWKPDIARKSCDLGAGVLNNIWCQGPVFEAYCQVAREYNTELVIMHAREESRTMQDDPQYHDVVREVSAFLDQKTNLAISLGVKPEKIWWDPGIGFGKTAIHNLQLLRHVPVWRQSGRRILLGISRKSLFAHLLGIRKAEDRLPATSALHTLLALHGVDGLRVHDVREAVQVRELLQHWHHA